MIYSLYTITLAQLQPNHSQMSLPRKNNVSKRILAAHLPYRLRNPGLNYIQYFNQHLIWLLFGLDYLV